MSGQFDDQVANHFTAFFRQIVEKGPKWLWQVQSNELFNAVYPPQFIMPAEGKIEANYISLVKHLKITQ
jgi:hypothetical protein